MLLKKYRNRLFNLIKESGLKVNDFDLVEIPNGPVYRLAYKIKNLYFDIEIAKDFHDFSYCYTKFDFNYSMRASSATYEFSFVLMGVKGWIENEVREYITENSTIDLWETIKNNNSLNKTLQIDSVDFNDQSPFTTEEKEQVKLGLKEAQLLIKQNFSLNDTQNEIVNARLKYLEEALERNVKFDWKMLAISTIIGMILNLTVDTTKGKEIWDLFSKIFANMPYLPVSL